jgi:hypothetical protein
MKSSVCRWKRWALQHILILSKWQKNIFIVTREEKQFSFILFCTCTGFNAKRLFPLESEIVKNRSDANNKIKQNKQNNANAKN